MRVELVIPTPALPCGVFEYTRDLAAALEMGGVEAGICAGPHEQVLTRLSSAGSRNLLHLQFGYYLYPPNFLAQILTMARGRRWPVMATMHGFSPVHEAHHRLLRSLPRVVVHSSRMAHEMARHGFDPAVISILAMPCPPLTRSRTVHHSRVGYFGFLLPHKGLFELLQAVAGLSRRYPSLEAVILSAQAPFGVSQGYRMQVERALLDPRLEGRVHWNTDYLDRETVLSKLSSCTMVVLPYSEHTEIGVSAAARVALACGRPLITTGASFFDGLEADTYRIASASPEHIAAALDGLLADAAMREEYSRRAAAHAQTHTWMEAARRLADIFRRLSPGSISCSAKSFLK